MIYYYLFYNILTPSPIGRGAVRPPALVFLPFTQNILRKPIPENFYLANLVDDAPINKFCFTPF